MPVVKLTYIGTMQTRPDGKVYREVGAEQWNGEKKSAWKTAPMFNDLKVGDEVDILLDEKSGKYINKVTKAGNPTPGFGGTGSSKGTFSGAGKPAWQPDPEKNTAVYTKYALDAMEAKLATKPEEAVALVMGLRKLVNAALLPKESLQPATAPTGMTPVAQVEASIKEDTLMALVRAYNPDADDQTWRKYIRASLVKPKMFEYLIGCLNACLAGTKRVDYTPDGLPAFVVV